MNGDLGKIYKAINDVAKDVAVIEERQANQHEENKRKLNTLDNLPCLSHIEKLKNLTWSVNIMWGVLIIGGLATAFVKAWVG